jgi:hypothetical protein
MIIHGKLVDLNVSATYYQDRFNHGTFFPHLSQAIQHAVAMPLGAKQQSASIVTRSGEQLGWEELNMLNDYLCTIAAKSTS